MDTQENRSFDTWLCWLSESDPEAPACFTKQALWLIYGKCYAKLIATAIALPKISDFLQVSNFPNVRVCVCVYEGKTAEKCGQ